MKTSQSQTAMIVPFPAPPTPKGPTRKTGLNRNREGSVRKVNGRVYVDFRYMGERVREDSGLSWNEQNAKEVRRQLDLVIASIANGDFRFAEVFSESKKKEFFTAMEMRLRSARPEPGDIRCGEYFEEWLQYTADSGNVTGRTLLTYRSQVDNYLTPFFGDKTFADINMAQIKKFITWAKKKRLRGKAIGNASVNKHLSLLKAICKSAAADHGWNGMYDPFFGWKKLKADDPYEKIHPFTLEEQKGIIEALPPHWRPYFKFAFATGLRVGEQIALKPGDIDWEKGSVRVSRAMTLDQDKRVIEGRTKNKYSRRTLIGLPGMMETLKEQMEVHRQFPEAEYLFCNTAGGRADYSHLLNRTWLPALKNAGIERREMKQTRHTFATIALSCGENPLWIARMMGHRNAEMIIKVYGKYVANARGTDDGSALAKLYEEAFGKDE